jgi:hypothetical protein
VAPWRQIRRERKAKREREAEIDKLTVAGRISTVLARELTFTEMTEIIRATLARAKGEGQVANQAARVLVELIQLTGLDPRDEDPEGIRWEDMTPQQRAVVRARVEKELALLDDLPEAEEPMRDKEL